MEVLGQLVKSWLQPETGNRAAWRLGCGDVHVEGHRGGTIPSEKKAKSFQECGVEPMGSDQLSGEEADERKEGLQGGPGFGA